MIFQTIGFILLGICVVGTIAMCGYISYYVDKKAKKLAKDKAEVSKQSIFYSSSSY